MIRAGSRFVSLEWTCTNAIEMEAFQSIVQTLAPHVLRAKGFLTVTGASKRHLVFQMVGRRASLIPADRSVDGCRLIVIGERDIFDPDAARNLLDGLRRGPKPT